MKFAFLGCIAYAFCFTALAQCPPVVTISSAAQTSVNVSVSPFTSGLYTLSWTCGSNSGTIDGLTAVTTKVSNLAPGCVFTAIVNSPMLCGVLPNADTAQFSLPCAPSTIQVTSATATAAQFSWTSIPGASNYRLFYKLRSAANWSNVITGNVTSFTLTGLMSDSVYFAYVCGLNCPAFGMLTQPSNYVSFFTMTTFGCGPAASVTAVSNACNQITANLSGGTGTWRTHVQRISPPPFVWNSYDVSSPVVNLSVYSTFYQTYLVTTQAVCGATASVMSNVEKVSNGFPPPNTINVSNINCNGFTVTWPTSVLNLAAHRLLTRPVGTSVWTTHYIGFDSTYSISTLLPNVSYELAMRTLRCNIQSPLSVSQTIYTDGPGCRFDEERDVVLPESNPLYVYPNPTHGTLNVAFDHHEDQQLFYVVYNAMGQQTLKGSLDFSNAVDVSQLSNGCYYIRLYASSGFVGKIPFAVAR